MRTKNVQVAGLDCDDLIAVPRSFMKRDEQRLRNGDMLISSANSWELVGKTSYVHELEYEATAGGFISIIRARQGKIDSKYLYYWLTSPSIQHKIRYCGRQTTNISNLDVERFKELEIPLPPLDEQERIAAILDKADAIRLKRKQAIILADDFLRSVFLDMFGDIEGNGWSLTTVEKLAQDKKGSMRTGPFGSQLLHSEFTKSGIAVLGIDNAVSNKFEWSKSRFISEDKYKKLHRYTVYPGDVIITIMGTCGRCAVVPDDIPTAINTKHLCCITLDQEKCLPSFLHAYFLYHPEAKRYLRQNTKGAIMAGLNMGIIKGMPVPEVAIELQEKYDEFLRQYDKTSAHLGKGLVKTEENFHSLSQKAFSGQL
nr:restriction endonuclease subunit S [Photobacterium galatheae]